MGFSPLQSCLQVFLCFNHGLTNIFQPIYLQWLIPPPQVPSTTPGPSESHRFQWQSSGHSVLLLERAAPDIWASPDHPSVLISSMKSAKLTIISDAKTTWFSRGLEENDMKILRLTETYCNLRSIAGATCCNMLQLSCRHAPAAVLRLVSHRFRNLS